LSLNVRFLLEIHDLVAGFSLGEGKRGKFETDRGVGDIRNVNPHEEISAPNTNAISLGMKPMKTRD
jgi:hypothetical protein